MQVSHIPSSVNRTILLQSSGVRQDRHKVMQLHCYLELKVLLSSVISFWKLRPEQRSREAAWEDPQHWLWLELNKVLSPCSAFQTPWLRDHVSIRARFDVPLLLFMGNRPPDRKDGVHRPELWVHSVNRHPSTERRPGKVCTGPKNTPAASSSASCHLKVTTGRFATWTTCYLCSFLLLFFFSWMDNFHRCATPKTQNPTQHHWADIWHVVYQ